jgi:homoserine dehydrogenase
VRESFNAVFVEGEKVGQLMLYGLGAGGDPTAASVVGDLIDLARNRAGGGGPSSLGHVAELVDRPQEGSRRRIRPIDELWSHFYLLLRVADRPGVLAAIATAFAEHGVSIKSVWQEGHGEAAQLVLVTHRAVERDLRACVDELKAIDSVEAVSSVLHVEGGEP